LLTRDCARSGQSGIFFTNEDNQQFGKFAVAQILGQRVSQTCRFNPALAGRIVYRWLAIELASDGTFKQIDKCKRIM